MTAMEQVTAVLLVDDERRSLEALRRTLEEDFFVHTASSVAQAFSILENETIHIVLSDQRMPDTTGVEFLKTVREKWPDTVRMILSGYTDTQDIIAAINEAGIYQYLLKPWHPDQLLLTLKRAAELYWLQQENRRLAIELRASTSALKRHTAALQRQVQESFHFDRIIRAPTSPMNAVCAQLAKAARFDVSILLIGESGTGKELLARAVHYTSARASRPFVTLNCGALPDPLLEAELFGYRKGAFSGASSDRVGLLQEADGGTLFLDEIGEASPAFQVKLLRVLQEGEFRPLGSNRTVSVDVRVIAATNRDLSAEIRAGRFRDDLYYRLAMVAVQVPALRERPMDIAPLAETILQEATSRLGLGIQRFSPRLLQQLVAAPWPGNVRELQNTIWRLLVLSDETSPVLEADFLAANPVALPAPFLSRNLTVSSSPQEEFNSLRREPLESSDSAPATTLTEAESRLLREVVWRHQGNLSRAAAELGLSRLGLRKKLNRLGIAYPARRPGRPSKNRS